MGVCRAGENKSLKIFTSFCHESKPILMVLWSYVKLAISGNVTG